MRLLPRLVFAGLLLGFVPVAPLGAALPHLDRLEWNSANHLTGYLTWNNGKGGISWSPGAPTDAKSPLVGSCHATTWSYACEEGVLEFVSDPAPRILYLNGSRDVIVDLSQSYGGRALAATLEVGSEWLGGSLAPGGTYCGDYESFYTCPPGSKFEPNSGALGAEYRIAPELSIIPAGSSIKLVLHLRPNNPNSQASIDLGGPGRSILRIPNWAEDEAFFRHPELFLGGNASPSPAVQQMGTASSSPESSVGVGLAVLSLSGAGRRRPRHLALVVLWMAGAFAGCLGGSPTGSDDGSDGGGGVANTHVVPIDPPIDPGAGARPNTGVLQGFVRDDLGFPVSGAHVSLPDVGRFATAASYGGFEFWNLTAGTYTLRIEKEGFRVHSVRVGVLEGNKTLINIELERLVADPSFAHPHNYWIESHEITMMDEDIPNFCVPGIAANSYGGYAPTSSIDGAGQYGQICQGSRGFFVPLEAPTTGRPNLVVPGTGEVEVKLLWNDPSAPKKLYLTAWANDADWGPPRTWFPRASEEPFRIQTTWEMTDAGHGLFTGWQFLITIDPRDPYLTHGGKNPIKEYTDVVPNLATPSFDQIFNNHAGENHWRIHVEITLRHRGALPIEPAHRDFWGASQTVEASIEPATSIPHQWNGAGPFSPGSYNCSYTPGCWRNLTPPETKWLQATATWDKDPVPPYAFNKLFYKSAEHPSRCVSTWYRAADPVTDAFPPRPSCITEAGPPTMGVRQATWVIPVSEAQTDPYYAGKTNWAFWLDTDDHRSAQTYGALAYGTSIYLQNTPVHKAVDVKIAFKVLAHRDPLPT